MPDDNIRKLKEPSKLHGTYPQKQKGLFMQRIPIFGGRLTAEQLCGICEIAVEFSDSSPLHLTTRQDIEFHNVAENDTSKVLERLDEIGFATFGAGGDSVRNITVCPCCKFDEEAYDTEPLAEQTRIEIFKSNLINNLGRKFKISFAGCDNPQTRPFVNDLSFIATSDSTFCVVGAGSLGPRPESGIILFDELNIEEVIPLTLGAVEMFSQHGDRNNRSKARFRHIRQRLGNEAFLELLNEYFQKHKGKYGKNIEKLKSGHAGWKKAATIQTVGGNIEIEDAIELADLAEKAHAKIRINGYHGIDIYSKNEVTLPEKFAKYTNLPRITACPGNSSCPRGIVNCPETAELIAEELRGNRDFAGKTIAVSGCPHNCACSAVADIGLVGRLKSKKPAYMITFNCGNGNTENFGEEQGIIPAESAGEWLKKNYN